VLLNVSITGTDTVSASVFRYKVLSSLQLQVSVRISLQRHTYTRRNENG